MSSVRPGVATVRNPTLPSQTTLEQRYWRGFTSPQLVKESHPVRHIDFNPAAPHDFAVASSTRIQVFSSKTRQVIKTFLRFKDTVYSGEYRFDGKLLVAADASGLVSIFDAYQPRNLLVSLQPSSYSTQVAKFHPSVGSQLVTGSDDRVLRIYDISQTATGPIHLFDDSHHGDYIRSACYVPGNPNLVSTACYDGVVRVFDVRQQQVVSTFEHGSPVEDVLAVSPTTLVSAGGPQVKVYDLARGLQIHELNNFTKTATCLHDTGDRGLLVGSLDGHVKIFDTSSPSWDVKFGWKYGSGGVLACAVSPGNHKHFVAGLTSGLVSIRTRKDAKPDKVKQPKTSAFARMMRGSDYHGDDETRTVETAKAATKKPKQFEKHLNGFRWSEALDSAFATGLPKEHTITVLHELRSRGKVRVSLVGRDEILLLPILQWFIRNIQDVRSFNLICDYIGVIVEMYGSLINKSVVLEEAFAGLMAKVQTEIRVCREASEIKGMLELLAV